MKLSSRLHRSLSLAEAFNLEEALFNASEITQEVSDAQMNLPSGELKASIRVLSAGCLYRICYLAGYLQDTKRRFAEY